MKYRLLEAQRKFLEIPHDYSLDVAVYQGGYGSGKTFAGSLLGILLALKFAGIRGLVGAQTYTLVRDTTLQSYYEHLDNMNFVEDVDYKWVSTEQKLVFRNGSEILFRHFEEPNKLKSLNLGFVEIDILSCRSTNHSIIWSRRFKKSFINPSSLHFRIRMPKNSISKILPFFRNSLTHTS